LQIQQLRFKAIVSGFVIDTFGTVAIAFAIIAAMGAAGFPKDEINVRMHGFSGLMLMMIIGLACTFIGGYFAGRIAGQAEVLHGGVIAGIGLVLGLFLREPNLPLWYEVVSFAALMPVGMAGGYFAREGNAKRKLTGRS